MPSLARSVPKPLKVPSLARSVPKPLKVPSLARSVPKPLRVRPVPKPLKVPSLARSVPKPLKVKSHQYPSRVHPSGVPERSEASILPMQNLINNNLSAKARWVVTTEENLFFLGYSFFNFCRT